MTREEAINLIKQVLPCLNIDEKIREGFVTLIPELKESEDERIRKNLIELLLDTPAQDIISHNLELSKVLAYLEKQKEQKHPDGCFTCDEYKKGYEEGRRNGFTAGYNKAMKEVEQKEQKPVDEQFPPLEGLDKIKAKYYDDGFKNGFDEGVESVKSAEWSEKCIADIFEKVGLAKIVREQGNDALINAIQSAMIELSKVRKI